MNDVWYAVCDQVRARFFACKPFELVGEIENEGIPRRQGTPHFERTEPQEESAFVFAGKIGDFLDRHLGMKDFGQVVVVADPKLAGKIHSRMTKRLSQHASWIQKDLGKIADRHLPEPLGLPDTVLPGFARVSTRPPGA